MRAIHTLDLENQFVPLPVVNGLDYYGERRPASVPVVGRSGDFFEFMPFDAGRLTISLGEISGRGRESAILMSGLQASLRGFAHHGRGRISGAVQALNKTFCELSPEELYGTLFYASVDAVSRELRYVSAGHEPVLLVRRHPARVRHLESTGAVLGLTRRTEYRQRTIWLEPGDLLIAFTDGITSAIDDQGREWCDRGVLEVVNQFPDARAVDLAYQIMEAAERFTKGVPALDDRTVVVVRFQGAQGEAILEERGRQAAFTAA